MEDGTPPPDSVVVERVCNGTPRPEGYTDSKGRFSVQLGRDSHMVTDASVGSDAAGMGRNTGGSAGRFGGTQTGIPTDPFGGMNERDLIGCEIRAVLAGYRSDVVMLSGRRMFDNPDVGTIVLHRLGNVEGSTISITSLKAPKNAKKAYENGRKELAKQKWANAQTQLQKAVEMYPEYAAAWYELGRSLEQQNKAAEAREAYQKAVAADAKFVNPYIQLAGLAGRENKWPEVADTTGRIIKLNPFDFPVAYFYNAVAHLNLQNLDAAEKSAQEAVKLDTQHRFPKASHLLGIILAQKGDFSGATKHLQGYLSLLAPNAEETNLVKKQIAEVERLMGSASPAAAPNP